MGRLDPYHCSCLYNVNMKTGFKKTGAYPLNPGDVTELYLALSKGLYKHMQQSSDESARPKLIILVCLHLQMY